MIVQVRQNAARGGVVLEVVQNPVDLIELALGILMLHAELIAVGLADGACLIRPAIPDMAAEVMDVVGFLLPDPQKLLNAGLVERAAQRHDGKFLAQIVAVHHAEFFDGVRRRAVLPMRAHRAVTIPYAVFQNIAAGLDIQLVSSAHGNSPFKNPNFSIL